MVLPQHRPKGTFPMEYTHLTKLQSEGMFPDHSIGLPNATASGTWQRMDLVQKDQDVATKTDVMLGGASVNPQGIWRSHWWRNHWKKIKGGNSGNLTIVVAPASATILHFSPAK